VWCDESRRAESYLRLLGEGSRLRATAIAGGTFVFADHARQPDYVDLAMAREQIPREYHGWWRITETSTWPDDVLELIGPALLSLTGHGDRLRLCCLLAHVNCRRTKTGVSFTWKGAWEYDEVSGSGSVKLAKDGRLAGKISIKDGDSSTFVAERADEPAEPIPDPPSYRDKWRRG
jgi:hypothetical protein